jgi:hypothetical protein
MRVSFLDGDARRTHGGLSWFGHEKALRPAGGRSLYFLAPKCSCRGYKHAREGVEPKSQGEEKEDKGDCLRYRSLSCVLPDVSCFSLFVLPHCRTLACPFIGREEAKMTGSLEVMFCRFLLS